MTEQIKPWSDYVCESRQILTESEKWAKDEAMKALDAHFKRLYPQLAQSESDAFREFMKKMKKL